MRGIYNTNKVLCLSWWNFVAVVENEASKATTNENRSRFWSQSDYVKDSTLDVVINKRINEIVQLYEI